MHVDAPVAGIPTDEPLLVYGQWLTTGRWLEVRSPYDDRLVGRVAVGDADLVDRAVAVARRVHRGVGLTHAERAAVLDRVAAGVDAEADTLARLVCAEVGKPITQARTEVARAATTLRLSASAARGLAGEVLPVDGRSGPGERLGLVLRVPVGVVAAITPFNFPLNLVAHKLGPALAAGNPVVLKPAEQSPLSALALARLFERAGLPPGWLQVICGEGPEIPTRLVEHPDVAAVSFTGSAAVGWSIRARAPRKRVLLELGSTAPLIVDAESDWARAADGAAANAFSFAGQACVSVQRIILHRDVAERFTRRLLERVGALVVGDPADPATDVGPLIGPQARERVLAWVRAAADGGAEVLAGGALDGSGRCVAPTVLREPAESDAVWSEEVFGPVAAIKVVPDFDAALALANRTRYGLQAGVFTRDLARALQAARELAFGGVLINEVPTFRPDNAPYGGVKDSGNTREGPAYAVEELTERRLVVLGA